MVWFSLPDLVVPAEQRRQRRIVSSQGTFPLPDGALPGQACLVMGISTEVADSRLRRLAKSLNGSDGGRSSYARRAERRVRASISCLRGTYVIPQLPKLPLVARHAKLSGIASLDDAVGQPDADLMRLGLEAASLAVDLDLSHLERRSLAARQWVQVFPGEHYRLLAALVEILRPTSVVEIGTSTGLSALAMLDRLPAAGQLTTFDVVPWATIPDSALLPEDLTDGRLVLEIGDLSDPRCFDEHADLLARTSLIFIDGPKDGAFETDFFRRLRGIDRVDPCFVVFDDIRLWNMLAFWRSIEETKLDLTSFGHWSGTGLCRLGPRDRNLA
jgi:predicted O-methyltransferase YrrM